MRLKDFIYAKTGVDITFDRLANDSSKQMLIASLLSLMAKSDGGISPSEMTRIVELLRDRFELQPGEALNMMTRTADEVADAARLGELLDSVNDELTLPHKEELLLMLLHVISADNEKDVAEMKFLAAVVDGLQIPEKMMKDVYGRYFVERKSRSA